MGYATFSTQRGSWGLDDPLLSIVGVAIPGLVIFQTTPFPEEENQKDFIKRERTVDNF